MPQLLKDLLSSKKAVAGLVAIAAIVLNAVGLPIPEDTLTQIVAVVMAYIVGQGFADIGKEAEKASR